jgi:hypothetical protein
VHDAAAQYRDDRARAEMALLLLRNTACKAYNEGSTPEEIAEACGWSMEQVIDLLQLC